MFPTAEARKANYYTQFRKRLRRLTLDDDGIDSRHELEGAEPYSEMYKVSHPELLDPKLLYRQTIFDEVYNGYKETVIHVD